MRHARVRGTGRYLPTREVTNLDLAHDFGIDTTDAWVRKRTGIAARRFADPGEGTATLATRAAEEALADAGMKAAELDLIIAATLSPDRAFPGVGVDVQANLGLPEAGRFVPCLDVRNQCSGFLYALSCGVAHIRGGLANRVLVVGAEVHSAALDLTTRGRQVSTLFGDGAGAVVLEASPSPGVLDVQLYADGRHAEDLCQQVWDMRRRPYISLDDEGFGRVPPDHLYAHMNGPAVFRAAVEHMGQATRAMLDAHGMTVGDVDRFLFHQANLRINRMVQQQLGIPDAKALHHIDRYGNTTAATIPILMAEGVREGQIVPGMHVLCSAFGAGFTWGAALMRW